MWSAVVNSADKDLRQAIKDVTKPVTFTALVDVISTMGRYWLEIVELPNGEVRRNE